MNFTAIQSEGSLISADLLAGIHTGEANGQKPGDFSLTGNVRLTDEIAACRSDARAYWEALQHTMRRIPENDSGATATREQWILPLLRTIGFDGVTFSRPAANVGGQTYFISHRLSQGDEGLSLCAGFLPIYACSFSLLPVSLIIAHIHRDLLRFAQFPAHPTSVCFGGFGTYSGYSYIMCLIQSIRV